jgi:uncharacterized protein (TIGR00725 family)
VPRAVAYIAVVGPGRDASADELAAAEEAGAAIADGGATLVCGGLGGAMEAACRGARSRGGLTVGLLPGTDREDANGWVTLALPTGLGEGRNALVVRAADAVVAIGGGWGTLSEIALALRAGVPVLGVRTWELARAGEPVIGVRAVDDAATAVAEALRLARSRRGIGTNPR